MLRSNAPSRPAAGGFTLLETMTVVSIVGILAAIGIPSVAGMHDRQKLNNAVEMVVTALGEAQLRAVESHRRCEVTLDAVQAKILGNGAKSCLVTGDRQLPSGISLTYKGNDQTIAFGLKGNTTDNRTILLTITNSKTPARCVVISAPIGIVRQGIYDAAQQLCQNTP